jgi:putative DNA methylase
MNCRDKRLIEDAIPVEIISHTSASEKVGGRIGHPSSLHLWWARRPLAASRAAVYATLVPASGRTRTPAEEASFFEALCRWGAPEAAIRTAREDVLAANGGVPPKVVDLFAGGGAIPLEAARLGCEVTANELNPVAHLIERMMLEFPQAHPGLAEDVRAWGEAWIDAASEQLADIYPPISEQSVAEDDLFGASKSGRTPLAYLWTRTVNCPNPALGEHTVDLVRTTWVAKKKGRVIALKPVVDRVSLTVEYDVVEAATTDAIGFDPAAGSARGQTTCRICGASVTTAYVKAEGMASRIGVAPLCAVVLRPSGRGRDYIRVGRYDVPDDDQILKRLEAVAVAPPAEPLPAALTGGMCTAYGLTRFQDLFTPRQLLTLCTLSAGIGETYGAMVAGGMNVPRASAVASYLAATLDRTISRCSSLCYWDVPYEAVLSVFARQALPMVWDFAEANPFGGSAADVRKYLHESANLIQNLAVGKAATCVRGSATALPLASESQDAVITDPPYYDNISYAQCRLVKLVGRPGGARVSRGDAYSELW